MDRQAVTIPASMTIAELSAAIGRGDSPLARRQGTPILDSAGKLAGIITRDDVLRALEELEGPAQTVLEAGTSQLTVAFPDETLRVAVERMLQRGVGRLPVVSRDDPRCLVGYLGRTAIYGGAPATIAGRKRGRAKLGAAPWRAPVGVHFSFLAGGR